MLDPLGVVHVTDQGGLSLGSKLFGRVRDSLALAAFAISLFALAVTWYYSHASLAIDTAPALTMSCDSTSRSHPDVYLALIPNKNFPGVHFGSIAPSPLYNDITCVVSNFGRLPVLEMNMMVRYQFYKVLAPGKTQTFREKIAPVGIEGIGAEQTAVLLIRNTSAHLCANVIVDPNVNFVLPDNLTSRISYVLPIPFQEVEILNPMNLSPAALRAPFAKKLPQSSRSLDASGGGVCSMGPLSALVAHGRLVRSTFFETDFGCPSKGRLKSRGVLLRTGRNETPDFASGVRCPIRKYASQIRNRCGFIITRDPALTLDFGDANNGRRRPSESRGLATMR